MATEKLPTTFFYTIEKAIKSYRQLAQRNISAAGLEITIDQWLVLKTLQENPDVQLTTIAADVFKDIASISRIVHVLEKKGYINRTHNTSDGRRSSFSLTRTGSAAVHRLVPIIDGNRSHALKGVTRSEMAECRRVLEVVIVNCLSEGQQ